MKHVHGETRITDKFFTQDTCDRCLKSLKKVRTMSWFTKECLCLECSEIEEKIKANMRAAGVDPLEFEGCGIVPKKYKEG